MKNECGKVNERWRNDWKRGKEGKLVPEESGWHDPASEIAQQRCPDPISLLGGGTGWAAHEEGRC